MRFSGLRGTALNPYFLGAVAIILLCSAGLGVARQEEAGASPVLPPPAS